MTNTRTPLLDEVSNRHEIRTRLYFAASQITVLMRATGRKLTQNALDVPTVDETYAHLEAIAEEAVAAFMATEQHAPEFVSREEIEGEAASGDFEIYVKGRGNSAISLELLMRLV